MELPKILIIVPCYNEEKRLNISEFVKNEFENIHFLFADDGSTDKTRLLLEDVELQASNSYTFFAKKNSGKGGVIRKAYLDAEEKGVVNNYDWIGFLDADLATPIYEINNMIKYMNLFYSSSSVSAIFGSRIYKLGSTIKRNPKRHYFGRLFATVISKVLRVKTYDSQCGAKLFRRDICSTVFKEEFISNWIFDVEILLRENTDNFIEYPLIEWTDVEGSKIKVFKEIPRILKDILNIWKKYIKKSH